MYGMGNNPLVGATVVVGGGSRFMQKPVNNAFMKSLLRATGKEALRNAARSVGYVFLEEFASTGFEKIFDTFGWF